MNKRTYLIFFCIFLLNICSQKIFSQQSIQLKLKNNSSKQAFFCAIKGEKLNVIALNKFDNDIVKFRFDRHLPVGIYKIYISDSAFVDIIIDKDTVIAIEASYKSKIDSIKVIEGNDNKKYYQYINYKTNIQNKLIKAITLINQKKQKNSNSQSEERINFIKGYFAFDLQKYTEALISNDSSFFVSKVIKAMQIPNTNIYLLEHPDSNVYRNDPEFLLSHFFDNIDFSDSSFINTELYYRTIKYYIEKLVLPRNVIGFNYANDFILNKAKSNYKVYCYIIELLIDLYENTQLEEVYVKLYTDYLLKNSKEINQDKLNKITARVNIINSLKIGTVAPEISGKDTLGKEIKLSDIKSNMVLLFIWTSYSKHAGETIEQLSDLYKKFKDYGFKIISVSLDTNEVPWKNVLNKLKPEWTNVINLQGLNGSISKSYNVWALPRFYIVDNKQTILERPMNIDYLKRQLETYYKK